MAAVAALGVAIAIAQASSGDWHRPSLFASREAAERVVEIDEKDPLLEGRGHCEEFRYIALWDVTLELTATSHAEDLGLFLEVVDHRGILVARDEEREGGPECALEVRLEAGRHVRVHVG